MNPFSEITINDMPNEDLRWIAEDCGILMASSLLVHFGKGISIYIPKFEPDDWKNIRIQDLPTDDMRLVAEKCGIELVQKLIKNFNQLRIYIPRLETTQWAKNYIKKTYNGSNAKRIATDLGVSERFIYLCIRPAERSSNKVNEYAFIDGCRQENLFGV
jgi:hypothetical protein